MPAVESTISKNHSGRARRSWFRFSTRELLIAMTLCGLALGWGVARWKAARGAVERRDLVLNQILQKRLRPPAGYTLARVSTLGLWGKPKNALHQFFSMSPERTSHRTWHAFHSGESSGMSSFECQYQLPPGPKPLQATAVCDTIAKHYTAGFGALGLSVRSALDSTEGNIGKSRQVWAAKGNEIVVTLDVEVTGEGQRATVRIELIESQDVSAW